MTTTGHMGVEFGAIDVDTHVVESEAVWSHFEDHGHLPRPYLVEAADPRTGVRRSRWVIDGKLVPKPEGKGAQAVATPPIAGFETGDAGDVIWAWRSMEDVEGRMSDSVDRGVSRQIVFPTIFLADLTSDPLVQVALARAYNRFMAERWETANRNFSWVVVPPLRDMSKALDEIEFGRTHGAVGVLFHGLEIDRSIGDPYFEQVYERAEELDLSICIHTGPGSPTMLDLQDSRYTRNFGHNRVLPLIGFHDLVFSGIPERFPSLRFGFLEASASWVPFLLHFLRRASRRSGRDPQFYGQEMFREYRIYVACEADEDLPYLGECIGWDNLLIGSDYGHTDQSAELDIVQKLENRSDLAQSARDKILITNPTRFYGLGDLQTRKTR
ncbi:MAG TPA: amidohydrolase family protein [Acidimicrobiales bacterium]|nr:amidohydrolase family protein [Acidimicrobiales bacterium]